MPPTLAYQLYAPNQYNNGRSIRISEFCFQLEETGNDGEKQTQSLCGSKMLAKSNRSLKE